MKFKFIRSFIKNNFKFYISLIVCSALCFSCYVTFNHVYDSVDNGLSNYIKEYKYYDGLLQIYDEFSLEDKDLIEGINGIDRIDFYGYRDLSVSNDKFNKLRFIIGDTCMISFKGGVLKVQFKGEEKAKLFYEFLFVINIVI